MTGGLLIVSERGPHELWPVLGAIESDGDVIAGSIRRHTEDSTTVVAGRRHIICDTIDHHALPFWPTTGIAAAKSSVSGSRPC